MQIRIVSFSSNSRRTLQICSLNKRCAAINTRILPKNIAVYCSYMRVFSQFIWRSVSALAVSCQICGVFLLVSRYSDFRVHSFCAFINSLSQSVSRNQSSRNENYTLLSSYGVRREAYKQTIQIFLSRHLPHYWFDKIDVLLSLLFSLFIVHRAWVAQKITK